MFLKIISIIFLIAGFLVVYSARFIVRRFGLDRNAKCDFANEMSEEELQEYKFNKTVVNVKMLGMLIALPGIVLLLIAFR